MRTAKDIIGMFMPHTDWNNEHGSAEKSACIKNAKACAIIYIDGIIKEAKLWCYKSEFKETKRGKELLKLKQEIYRYEDRRHA